MFIIVFVTSCTNYFSGFCLPFFRCMLFSFHEFSRNHQFVVFWGFVFCSLCNNLGWNMQFSWLNAFTYVFFWQIQTQQIQTQQSGPGFQHANTCVFGHFDFLGDHMLHFFGPRMSSVSLRSLSTWTLGRWKWFLFSKKYRRFRWVFVSCLTSVSMYARHVFSCFRKQ